MKQGMYKKTFITALAILLAAVYGNAMPPQEVEPPDVPDFIEALLKTRDDSPGFFGFGFLLDVPDVLMVNDDGLPLQVDLIKLKDFEKGEYLTEPVMFPGTRQKIVLPPYLVFNLDIYYGAADETRPEKKAVFDVSEGEPGITVYFIHRRLRLQPAGEPALFYWIAGRDEVGWVSHPDATELQMKYDLGMEISEIIMHPELGLSSFTIRRWPVDDRVIGIDD